MITSRQIKSTKTFQGSNKVIQEITLSKTNIQSLKFGLNKVNQIGFDQWQNETKSGSNNQEIIKELIKLKSNNNARSNRRKNQNIKRKNQTVGSYH